MNWDIEEKKRGASSLLSIVILITTLWAGYWFLKILAGLVDLLLIIK